MVLIHPTTASSAAGVLALEKATGMVAVIINNAAVLVRP